MKASFWLREVEQSREEVIKEDRETTEKYKKKGESARKGEGKIIIIQLIIILLLKFFGFFYCFEKGETDEWIREEGENDIKIGRNNI